VTVRFDEERGELRLSVRDIAFLDRTSGVERDLAVPLSRVALGRVAQGVHRERARLAARSRDVEVGVRFETTVLDYRVVVTGRIDALRDEGESLCVEEVKTIFRRGDRIPRDPFDPGLESFRRQVRLYAFFVETERAVPVRCRLALVSAVDGTAVELPVEYRRAEVESFLVARLERIVREHLGERSRRRQMREFADSLVFPFPELRPRQGELMQCVTETLEAGRTLLLSAPAGTGKTIGVLYPAVEHAMRHGKRVFFVTAKNTQGRMALDMLRRLGIDRSPLRAMFLRAKGEMCATGDLVCHDEVCPYIADLPFRLLVSGLAPALLEEGIALPERVRDRAVEHRLCPFYTQIEMTRRADLLVGDYNYVFDPVASLGHLFEDRAYRDFVLVVDEAHNLPRRVMEAYSPVLERAAIRDALDALRDPFDPVKRALSELVERLDRLVVEIRGTLDPAPDEQPFEPDVERFLALRDDLERWLLRFLVESDRPPVRAGEDPLASFFFALAQFLRVLEMEDLPRVVSYRRRPNEAVRILNLDPSSVISSRLRGFAGAVLMSATLAPIEFYRRTLGVSEPDLLEVEFPSPFPPENRALLLEGRISTRFRDRERAYPRVAALIHEVVEARRGNYLCFFPSFRFLQEVRARLDESRVELIAQKPAMGTRARAEILDRLDHAPERRSRVVLAVQGGILAEGVDYPGERCVGVIVVGPGLPQVGFDNECIRRHFDDVERRGFEFAYLFPGLNRVIQSAGRLIRTPEDRGVLILVGQRFRTEAYRRCLPEAWLRDGLPGLDTRAVGEEVRGFWWRAEGAPEPGIGSFSEVED